jgi:tRNA G18 (ribose-2'-O)-methylase SpoU
VADPLEDYRALNDHVTRRQVERRGDYFVVEGLLALEALLGSRYPVRSVLATERRADRVAALVAGRAPLVVRPEAEVAEVAGFDVHRGVLAAADRLPLPGADDLVAAADLVVVVEGVTDHENVGALFRNAAAFGAGAVLLDPTTADPLYRRSVRVSLGHVLRVPWTRVTPWPGAMRDLADQGFAVLALTPAADAAPIGPVADALGRAAAPGADGRRRVALVVGSEGPGLSEAAMAAPARRVRIPLAHGVDSLNVATAVAVALHAVAGDRLG